MCSHCRVRARLGITGIGAAVRQDELTRGGTIEVGTGDGGAGVVVCPAATGDSLRAGCSRRSCSPK